MQLLSFSENMIVVNFAVSVYLDLGTKRTHNTLLISTITQATFPGRYSLMVYYNNNYSYSCNGQLSFCEWNYTVCMVPTRVVTN